MSKLTEFFTVPQHQIVESIVGKPSITLGGFAPEDVVVDHWTRPGINSVSAHTTRPRLREAIARKHRQIRIAWGSAWIATIVAAALFGFSIAMLP